MGKYLAIARTSFMERAAYRADVIARSLFMVLILFVFVQLFGKVMGSNTAYSGFSHRAVIWYIVVTESLMLSTPALGKQIDGEVKSGAFAAYLLRPCNYVFFHLSGFLGESVLGIVCNLCAGAIVALTLVGPPPLDVTILPIVALAVLLGVLLNFCLTATIALLSFWVEDNEPFFWIYHKFLLILGGVMIPLDFFPETLRQVARHLPFGYIFYGPARLCVQYSNSSAFSLVRGQLVFLAIASLLLFWVYSSGVRRVNVNGG